MKTIDVHTRVVSLAIAILFLFLFLFQISPTLAEGQATAQDAMTQGSRFPGWPVPDASKGKNEHAGGVDVTFTKWITTYPLMAGTTGKHAAGVFAGEIFQRQVSQNGRLIRLEAMYEVQAGGRSFTALIRGGTDAVTGAALLDGVILAGWRTGAKVHVEFQTTTNCAGAPDVRTCFEGTIHIEPAP